jgi:hypothetical protein
MRLSPSVFAPRAPGRPERRPLILAASVLAVLACAPVAAPGPRTPAAITVVPAAGTPVRTAARSRIVVFPGPAGDDSLWRVSSDGAVEPLDWPPASARRSSRFALAAGTDRPTPSPDGTRVAYVEDRSLAIRELATGRTTVVHRAVADTEVAITAWSPDGGELLYATMPHPPPDPDSETDLFGDDPTYHRYDIGTCAVARVAIAGTYVGWLPTGELVIEPDPGGQKLLAVKEAATRVLTREPFRYGEVRISADGKRLVATASRPDPRGGETIERIVAVDPRTGETTPLTPPGGFAEHANPALSPGTNRLAYVRVARLASGSTTKILVVDGREVTTASQDLFGFEWIDDDAIVLRRARELVVIDASSGEVRGKTPPR